MTGPRVHWLPVVWGFGWTALLGVALFAIPWSFIDVFNHLRDATAWGLPETVRNAFSRDVEYRPLFTLSIRAAYDLVGLRLWVYHALVLLQFGAILALLIWLFQPRDVRRAIAGCIALSCVIGLHSSRVLFSFWPLNHHSGGLVLLLLATALALDPRTRSREWIYFPLILAALLLLESGLIIVPLIAILWWVDAPGLSHRGVLGATAALGAYAAIRLGLGTVDRQLVVYTSSGLGFSDLSPEALRNIFEHAPWLLWIYNVLANLLTVLVSEPRAGVYRFVESLLRGDTALWQWIQVGSSVLTTAAIVMVLVMSRVVSTRDRLLLVSGCTFIACGSALGFLYTRDRIALSAGVGYSLLLYVALAALLERDPGAKWKRVLVTGGICAIAAGWILRSGESYFQLRDAAWDAHLEWTDRYEALGGPTQPQIGTLLALKSAALESIPDDPRRDPPWTYSIFERRFTPGAGESRGTPDSRADTVVRPPSPPFDIRWKSEVTEENRLRLEAELGLMDAQRVERDPRGQTYTYRLRQPTLDRVRDIVMHPAVEDTARVDTARFRIAD